MCAGYSDSVQFPQVTSSKSFICCTVPSSFSTNSHNLPYQRSLCQLLSADFMNGRPSCSVLSFLVIAHFRELFTQRSASASIMLSHFSSYSPLAIFPHPGGVQGKRHETRCGERQLLHACWPMGGRPDLEVSG